jgi:hypothetical protein
MKHKGPQALNQAISNDSVHEKPSQNDLTPVTDLGKAENKDALKAQAIDANKSSDVEDKSSKPKLIEKAGEKISVETAP